MADFDLTHLMGGFALFERLPDFDVRICIYRSQRLNDASLSSHDFPHGDSVVVSEASPLTKDTSKAVFKEVGVHHAEVTDGILDVSPESKEHHVITERKEVVLWKGFEGVLHHFRLGLLVLLHGNESLSHGFYGAHIPDSDGFVSLLGHISQRRQIALTLSNDLQGIQSPTGVSDGGREFSLKRPVLGHSLSKQSDINLTVVASIDGLGDLHHSFGRPKDYLTHSEEASPSVLYGVVPDVLGRHPHVVGSGFDVFVSHPSLRDISRSQLED